MFYNLQYRTTANFLSSELFHPLSKNGPYIDIHLGSITKDAPIGQTYFIRPNSYIKNNTLHIDIKKCELFTHFNNNTITDNDKLWMEGKIIIYPFIQHGCKYCGTNNQIVSVNITLNNNTGFNKILGIHIHDGVRNDNGLTGFGPISYFLYTSYEWLEKFHKKDNYVKINPPVPYLNINPKYPIQLLEFSRQNLIKINNVLPYNDN